MTYTRRALGQALAAAGLLSLTIWSGCGQGGTEEDEIVIRAEDFADSSLALGEDTVFPVMPPVDSLAVDTCRTDAVPDTLAPADSIVAFPTDSLIPALPDTEAMLEEPALGFDTELLSLELHGSLYSTLASATGEGSDVLGAHCARAMWWDLDPWNDLIAGDSLYILCCVDEEGTGRENRIVALRYVPVEGSANHAFSVYLFLKQGDNYPSFFYRDGGEVTPLLSSMPLSTFEEVTGIYGEPRGTHTHHGVDFKAPTGTPVRTVRGGTVVDLDWNTEYNGHCVKLDIGGGYREIFIHLDQVDPALFTGSSVAAGGVVGTVGNTGRSMSPHLHYQIDDLWDSCL